MEENSLRRYLRLCIDPALGAAGLASLLQQHGSLSGIHQLLAKQGNANSASDSIVAAFERSAAKPNCAADKAVDRALNWARQKNHRIIAFEHKTYPFLLRQIPRPPPLIYAKGNCALLDSACVAIVGSRAASSYGKRHARYFAHELSRLGFTIVSGMARGIDAIAHCGALQASGSTIAVLGTGIDTVYPRGNSSLSYQIENEGLLLSEFPLGAPPRAAHFPQRNRIIAGISLGTIVVESGLRSGSLITAKLAAEQGRQVFTLPGPIDSKNSKGCHWLLKQGAMLAESADEICDQLLQDWNHYPSSKPEPGMHTEQSPNNCNAALSDTEREIVMALTEPEMLVERLVKLTGMSASACYAALVLLEAKGMITQQGGRVSRA